MGLEKEILDRLNGIIQITKANLKTTNCLVQYISQISMDSDKKIDEVHKDLKESIKEMENEIQKLGKLSAETVHVYSDEELYNLKKTMSWTALSCKTKIPVSTLQYRHRRYVKEQLDF